MALVARREVEDLAEPAPGAGASRGGELVSDHGPHRCGSGRGECPANGGIMQRWPRECPENGGMTPLEVRSVGLMAGWGNADAMGVAVDCDRR